jgi:hypothetical protein
MMVSGSAWVSVRSAGPEPVEGAEACAGVASAGVAFAGLAFSGAASAEVASAESARETG